MWKIAREEERKCNLDQGGLFIVKQLILVIEKTFWIPFNINNVRCKKRRYSKRAAKLVTKWENLTDEISNQNMY